MLTKYTTLRHSVGKALVPLGLDLLRAGETPLNVVLGTHRYCGWLANELDAMPAVDGEDFERFEEVERFYREWMLNKDIGKVRRLIPTNKGLWRVNLNQSRLFGWAPEKGALILDIGCGIESVKTADGLGYDHYISLVEGTPALLGLPVVYGDIRCVRNS